VLSRADALETLAHVTHVALDKTGTLTVSDVRLREVVTFGSERADDAIRVARALEQRSEHPIARAIAAGADGHAAQASEVAATPGQGIEGTVEGMRYRIGRVAFVAGIAGDVPGDVRDAIERADDADTLVALGSARGWLALFALGDALRPGAQALADSLRALNVEAVLLSGDRAASVDSAARALGIRRAHADCTPQDKREHIVALQREGAVVAMAGDGVNDAPGLAQAQVSVSLGSATPLAQWTADVVVLSDDVSRIGEAVAIARRALGIVRQNLAWATLYNAVAIPAAALGWVTPLAAAIGMSASSLVVVLNAARLARAAPRLHTLAPT
jgi:Cu2+-exporting ATPase